MFTHARRLLEKKNLFINLHIVEFGEREKMNRGPGPNTSKWGNIIYIFIE